MSLVAVARVTAAALVLAAPPAFAQRDAPAEAIGRPWALGIAGQLDEESNDSLLATFNWGVTPSTWLSFSAGRSRSPADRADVAAETLTVAVDHRFGAIGFGLEVEQWGDPDSLESSDLGGSLYVDRERFRIGFTYKRRDFDIPFTLTGPLGGTVQRTAELGADSTGIHVRVEPAERWRLLFAATEHDYDRDLALLPRIERLNLLSASTLTLTNGFIDHERMMGFERELGRSLLNVSVTRDRSAVDGSKFETVNAAMLFPIAARMDLEVNLGRGRSDLLDSGLHGGVLLLIYGR